MASNYICPFCMNSHSSSISICPEHRKSIPIVFLNAIKNNEPVFSTVTIGFRSHGKTCYLSSLFYQLYDLPHKWDGFSFIPLNQESLNTINDNIRILTNGHLPPATPVMFPAPSIIYLQNMPMLKNKKGSFKDKLFSNMLTKQKAILSFYDVGGETFNDDDLIKTNLNILKSVNHLMFLIDLPKLLKDSQEQGLPAEIVMQNLLSGIYNALSKMDSSIQKGITVCFTKSDLMSGKSEFGPLSEWENDEFPDDIPPVHNLEEYISHMKLFSLRIEDFVKTEYPGFYNALVNNFNPINFSIFSSLGSNPENGELSILSPKRVFDPILWSLIVEGYL